MIPLLVWEKINYYIYRRNMLIFRQKIAIVNAEYHDIYEYINGMILARNGEYPKWNFYNNRYPMVQDGQHNIVCNIHTYKYIYRPKLQYNVYEKIYKYLLSYVTYVYDDYRTKVGYLPEKYWFSSGKNSIHGYF